MWFTSIESRISAISAGLVPTLLDITLKGTVILFIAFLIGAVLRRSSAAMRYLVWFLSIMTVLLLPVLSATLPSWRILPPLSITGNPIVASQTEPAFISRPTIIPAVSDVQILPMYSLLHASISSPQLGAHDPQRLRLATNPALGWQAWLLIVWLIGSLSYLLYLMLGYLYLWHLQRRSYPLVELPWPGLLNQACATIGFQRSVELIGNSGRALPMTWGIFQTRILIPADSANWNDEQCRAVLLHELAHARRLDCLTQLITQFACAWYWFNPLMWFAWHRMQAEREQACDDMVLSAGTKPSAYAQQLLHIAAQVSSSRFANIAIAMARPGNLEGRLLAILDVKRNRQMISWTAGLAAILVMAFIATPLAMLHAADQPQTNAATTPAVPIDQPPVDPVTIAQGIIDHMSHGEFKQATDPFDSVMKKFAPPQTLEQIWKLLDQSGGKYLGRGVSRSTHEKQFQVVYVPMKWEHNIVEMKIVFDDKNQVTGMWTVAPDAAPATSLVFVMGDVTRSGAYSIPEKGLTLHQLLVSAGRDSADCVITVHRHDTSEVKMFRLEDILSGRIADPSLEPGDVAMVSESGDPTTVPVTKPTMIAPTTRPAFEIYLSGKVHRPGVYQIGNGGIITLLEAVASAGPDSQDCQIKLFRRGDAQLHEFRLKDLMDNRAADMTLESGDNVQVTLLDAAIPSTQPAAVNAR